MNLLQAIGDPQLFGPWFAKTKSWLPWRTFIASMFALPMTDDMLACYRQCTGRQNAPTVPFKEAWLIIGRRGGKSFFLALLSVFLACFNDYRQFLAPGERATVLVIAADRKQARVIMRFVRGLLMGVPMLKAMIERETAESFDLDNSVTIEVATSSFRTVRGYSVAASINDELAFWRSDDSANPDEEVLAALRPAMATIPSGVMLCGSSPYAQRGALWNAFTRYYGKEGAEVLVWKAPTRTMNPTVPQSVIDRAYAEDAAKAGAEYGAEFRNDIEQFLTRTVVETCVDPGVFERPPNTIHGYCGFVDQSGGVNDAMTLGIAHLEGVEGQQTAVLDLLREVKAPFSPEAVVSQYCDLLKKYRISKVFGDRYGSEWVSEQFRANGVNYAPSDKSRSELYSNLLPIIMSRSASLIENTRMVDQLVSLERRTTLGKRDSIDHRPGGHDDVANAAAGALVHAKAMPPTRGYQRQREPAIPHNQWDPLKDFRRRS